MVIFFRYDTSGIMNTVETDLTKGYAADDVSRSIEPTMAFVKQDNSQFVCEKYHTPRLDFNHISDIHGVCSVLFFSSCNPFYSIIIEFAWGGR